MRINRINAPEFSGENYKQIRSEQEQGCQIFTFDQTEFENLDLPVYGFRIGFEGTILSFAGKSNIRNHVSHHDLPTLEIKAKESPFHLRIGEIWAYKELILLLVNRELKPLYKQTVLGPLWFLLQPLFTTLTYALVFGVVARIPTGGMPQILFFMPGVILWTFFNSSFIKVSGTFVGNAHIFGKVYFPRLVVPLASLLSSGFNFVMQFIMLAAIFGIYLVTSDHVHLQPSLVALPLILLIAGLLALGLGLIVTSLTIKYRDLSHFLNFGTQLLMYGSAIIYPASLVPKAYRFIFDLNPLVPLVEGFRHSLLGVGEFSWAGMGYAALFTVVTLFIGLVLFNKSERTSMDTI